MTGYEFTRFEADYTCKAKAQRYEASIVAMHARKSFDDAFVDYTKDADYIDAREWFIETTMSCNKKEAIEWMKYYMANAIAYGIQTKNLDWKTKFLAAYDIFIELTQSRYAMGPTQARFLQNC